MLLDVGANVDCKAHNLEQFAVMGEMYARSVLKIDKPRVGLLSIGEEETKGNDLTREAFPLLKALPIHFIGNVEGRDIFNGQADVIVCDGFVGNVALKTSEGVGRFVRDVLRESLTRTVTAQVGALLSRRAFNDFRRRLDYTRIRRRAAARRARRLHHRPRLLQRRRHLQRHPRGLRVLQLRRQSSAWRKPSPAAPAPAPIPATTPTPSSSDHSVKSAEAGRANPAAMPTPQSTIDPTALAQLACPACHGELR